MDCCAPKGNGLMRVEEALAEVERLYGPVEGTERVPLMAALGRVLAEPVRARGAVPGCDVSAMDGYALQARHGAARTVLPVAGRVAAGQAPGVGPIEGQATRIFTGAPVPDGADAVVMQEDVELDADGASIRLRKDVQAGSHIRPMGEDMVAGQEILPAGRHLRPQDVGAAAVAGHPEVTVRRRVRAALFSTGDELAEPGVPLAPGHRYDANRYGIGAALTALGVHVTDLGILPDRREDVRAALAEAAGCHDLVVTSGGVSVGDEDHVKAGVSELGKISLWRLALKPSKPIAFGRVDRAAFLGLPGNPVSALVTFLLLGRPLVQRLSGAEVRHLLRAAARAGFSHRKPPGRREYLRARLVPGADGLPVAEVFGNDSSGAITSMTWADALVELPEAAVEIAPGDPIRVIAFECLLQP